MLDKIYNSKDWYFMQGFSGGSSFRAEYTVIFAKNKKELIPKAQKWQKDKNLEKIHSYRANYKPRSAQMVETGNYIA